jgi:hypothetical protein
LILIAGKYMTPLQDPGVQSDLNVMIHAPLIAALIAIPILIIGALIKLSIGKNGRRRRSGRWRF